MGSIARRTAVAIALPLAGVLLLAALVAVQWRDQLQEARLGQGLAALAAQMSAVVAALQEERSASAAALTGARGFQDMLPELRSRTDQEIRRLDPALAAGQRDATPLAPRLAAVQAALARIARERERVDVGGTTALATADVYTRAIRWLLAAVSAVALDTSSPALAEDLAVYERLMEIMELQAQERGLGAALLGPRGADPELYRRYLNTVDAQRAILREFEQAPPGSPGQRVIEQVRGQPGEAELQAFRRRLADPARLAAADPEAALVWFALATDRSRYLAGGLERVARQMDARAEQLAAAAKARFAALAAGLLGLVVLLAVTSLRLGRGLVWQMRAERRDAERIRYLGQHDQLTGLPNRDFFQQTLETRRRETLEAGQILALHLLDIVDFKGINRVFGSAVGDAVIVEVGRRLADLAPAGCTARLYGDQFAVIQAPLSQRQDAEALARSFLAAFATPIEVDDRQIQLELRIGITLYPPDAKTRDLLLRNADLARQHVDAGARGGYRFYISEMYQQYAAARTLTRDLKHADIEREFFLLYQPKVDPASRRMTGIEALVRWNHPARGLLQPSEFVAEAERSGAIIRLGAWAFAEACRQARAWQRAGLEPPVVAVNLSAVQLHHPTLVSELANALRDSGVAPSRVEIEITESAMIGDVEETLGRLRALRGLGLELAIDDFGTGYSSLTYLQRLPATAVKLDRTFIVGLETSPQSQRIVSAVIALAHGLSLRVTAEGVETDRQLEMLRERGCDEVQGFLLSPPVDAAELSVQLKTQRY